MKMWLRAMLLLTVLALVIPVPALAQDGTQGGRVVFGSSFTLRGGETMDGDLAVFGGNVVLEEDSLLDGDMLVIGGNAVVGGEISGDIVVLGGNVDLLNPAVVDGDIVSFGGRINQAERATVRGRIIDESGRTLPLGPRVIPQVAPSVPALDFGRSVLLNFVWFVFRTLLLAALAVLVVMFWPEPAERVATALVDHPLAAGGLGVLTVLVLPILLVLMLVTILLSPISLIGGLLLIVGGVFGWIACGLEVGERLTAILNWDAHPAAAAGIGTLLLTFVAGGLAMIPCIGWLAPFIVVSLGLGAVLLTRFGTREYEVLDPQAA